MHFTLNPRVLSRWIAPPGPATSHSVRSAMPIGIGLSSASRTPMDPGTWPYRTGPDALALVTYSMASMTSEEEPIG
jgi:hypothetical protein